MNQYTSTFLTFLLELALFRKFYLCLTGETISLNYFYIESNECASSILPAANECGQLKFSPENNDLETNVGDHPWIVALKYWYPGKCGACSQCLWDSMAIV